MHKTSLANIRYDQNILQPSFVGPFDAVRPRHLPTMPVLCNNPGLQIIRMTVVVTVKMCQRVQADGIRDVIDCTPDAAADTNTTVVTR